MMIPRRTSGSENTRRSEGTPLVPQERSAGKDVVTAREGYQHPKKSGNCKSPCIGKRSPNRATGSGVCMEKCNGPTCWQTAWRRVKANAGAAGVDGVTIEEIAADAQMEAAWLSALREELHRKTYRPAPVRRVKIPKASGGVRALGIPTVKDRVVQMAVYLVLMPIFEADFHPHSYGFRPGREAHASGGSHPARHCARGRTEVVDADLAQYFDTIPHRELLRQVARRVSDGMILKLIKGWLRAPMLEEEEGGGRRMKANPCGTPQGGVISPLLANIYLHPLDEAVNDQCRAEAADGPLCG